MKVSKALEILELNANQQGRQMPADALQAVRLGIEALKHYQESSHFACGNLLPGQTAETPEDDTT